MPTAHQGEVKYAYRDYDTDVVNEAPPVLNQWYTVFDAEDVRLLQCTASQMNDELAAKDLEVRWTVDGTVYFISYSGLHALWNYICRDWDQSTGGTSGLNNTNIRFNAMYYVDKRGHSFKVEVRITSALGTNQILQCYCVRETLEQT